MRSPSTRCASAARPATPRSSRRAARASPPTAPAALEGHELCYLFLPLAHAFALLIQFVILDIGGVLAYWEKDPQKIVPNLMELKPTYFPSVPRIFEKI